MWESRGYALIIVSIILLAITIPPIALYGTGHIALKEEKDSNLFYEIGFVGTAIFSFLLIFMGIKIQWDLSRNRKTESIERKPFLEIDTSRATLPPPIARVNEENIIYEALP
jgi:hypothetical protein